MENKRKIIKSFSPEKGPYFSLGELRELLTTYIDSCDLPDDSLLVRMDPYGDIRNIHYIGIEEINEHKYIVFK